MSELSEIVSKLKPSRSIFTIKASESLDYVYITAVDATQPKYATSYLEDLVNVEYLELFDFNDNKFKVRHNVVIDKVLISIKFSLRDFVNRNLKLPNPKRTKLYKWVQQLPFTKEYDDEMVMLYKYMMSIPDLITDRDPHIKNIMAILKAMEEKHSERQQR